MLLKELKYVIAISEFNNVSKAAKHLYISQPALSKYIKNLENTIGIKLFNRFGNKLTLTYSGELYLHAAKEILEIFDKLAQDLWDIEEVVKGKLKIGIPIFRGAHVLPKVLPIYKKLYPDVEILLFEDNTDNLESMLINGETDITIVNLPITLPNIKCIPIFDEEILLSVPQDHPLTNMGKYKKGCKFPWIDINLFKNDPFILLKRGQRTREFSDKILSETKISPRKLIETRNIETALKMSAAGLGISFIPETYALNCSYPKQPYLFSVGNGNTKWTLAIAYRENGYLIKSAQKFIDIIVNCYN